MISLCELPLDVLGQAVSRTGAKDRLVLSQVNASLRCLLTSENAPISECEESVPITRSESLLAYASLPSVTSFRITDVNSIWSMPDRGQSVVETCSKLFSLDVDHALTLRLDGTASSSQNDLNDERPWADDLEDRQSLTYHDSRAVRLQLRHGFRSYATEFLLSIVQLALNVGADLHCGNADLTGETSTKLCMMLIMPTYNGRLRAVSLPTLPHDMVYRALNVLCKHNRDTLQFLSVRGVDPTRLKEIVRVGRLSGLLVYLDGARLELQPPSPERRAATRLEER